MQMQAREAPSGSYLADAQRAVMKSVEIASSLNQALGLENPFNSQPGLQQGTAALIQRGRAQISSHPTNLHGSAPAAGASASAERGAPVGWPAGSALGNSYLQGEIAEGVRSAPSALGAGPSEQPVRAIFDVTGEAEPAIKSESSQGGNNAQVQPSSFHDEQQPHQEQS
jgi:hypothetical protein